MRTGGILTADLSGRSTGYFYGYPGDFPVWGHVRFAEPDDDLGTIGLNVSSWFREITQRYEPKWVVWEQFYLAPVANARTVAILYGMNFLVHTMCKKSGILVKNPSITQVAKHFIGKGRWPKGEKKAATQRMCAHYGFTPVTEDEADAGAVWIYAEAALAPKSALERGVGPLFIQPAASRKTR